MSEYKIDDVVSYGKNGICRISDIKKMKFDRADEREYYILTPFHDKNATYFVPLDSPVLIAKMRKAMPKDEIDAILESAKDKSMDWVEDKKERNEVFRSILSGGDPKQMLLLAHCIYSKKREKENSGRKLWACDEALLQSLEKIISEEMSWSIGIPESEVGNYIRKKLGVE